MLLITLCSVTAQSQASTAAAPTNLQLATAGFALMTGFPQNLVSYFLTPEFQRQIAQVIGDSATDSTTNTPVTTLTPVLNLNASATSVQPGAYVTLNWNSLHTSQCTASGGWAGPRVPRGSQVVGPIITNQRYLLSCAGHSLNGGAVAEVTIAVAQPQPLALQMQVSRASVPVNSTVELSWNATSADYCTAGRDWAGQRATSGKLSVGPLTESATFDLTCFRGSEQVVQLVTVDVRDHILRWRAPTANSDGTPLEDIGGYRIYWGKQSQNYSDSVDVPPDTTEWWADLAPGTYYFAMSTIGADGIESTLSPEIAIPVE
ncbi:MAG: hypothetical protein AAF993_06975 [Pseudomonadota bacterium]